MDDDVSVGAAVVLRTARIGVRATPAQSDRLYGLLRSAGDIWAALVELNGDRARRGAPPQAGYQQLCRELTGVDVGELSVAVARSVLRRYSDAWFEANRRKRAGDSAARTILDAPAGPAHRWRTRAWRHGHLLRTLVDKAAQAGIVVQVVDERGTSSTCPGCAKRHKPSGRAFACPSCGLSAHRDLVGATNIARRPPSGGEPGGPPPADTTVPAVVKHRRAGRHLPVVTGTRRASPPAPEATPYRRHLWDDRRRRRAALPGSGPPHQGSRTRHPTVDVDHRQDAAQPRAKTETDH